MRPRPVSPAVVALLLATALAACSTEATLPDPEEPGPTGEITVDASSNTAFTYLDLDDLEVVTPADPDASTDWELAFRRYEVRLNGGLTGPGDVTAALAVDHAAEEAAVLLGYTPANRLAEFEAIGDDDIPAPSVFGSAELVHDPSSWFAPAGPTLVANPARAWKVRRADGGHALLRVAELGFAGQGLDLFRVEYRLQEGNGTLGPIQSTAITPGAPGAPTRLSLATGTATTGTGCGWDIAVDAALTVLVNGSGGCSAGTFPLESGESFDALTTAADAPAYGPFLAAVSSPIANSVAADDSPPFLYGIDPVSQHRLTPSYNIYLVRRGSAVFKVQFLGYYHPAGGASGHLTLRVARIR